MDGKQVGILVPTTVLAQQHFRTFRRRLSAFPVEVEMLSRFRTRAETAAILERMREGQVDIVIGTHRLLQKDVKFDNLGLLIIDEEQRFGVTHKEFLKSLRTEVDVLTLTATPIPRTLYLALTGVRDISTIDTAPEDRLPVITHTGAYDPGLIRQAILRELDRGGQVFFVHNRVQSIDSIKARLLKLVPEAKIEVAHGQMPEGELSSIMSRFTDGEIEVLLSTSIIESGLDIPNANTLIVDRADQFGLAQLYQLRGRVGRGALRAYAYFFHHSRGTPEALQRLDIISENSQLGAGYSIALRDLEMRGAGDLLGRRQHGHIAAVGFHLYTQLLGEAVRRLRDETEAAEIPELPMGALPLQVSIELPLSGALTTDYVPDRDLRLQLYRRMAGLRTLEEVEMMRSELSDRFGTPPPEVDNLLYQLRVKVLAAEAGIVSISSEGGQILIQFTPGQTPARDLGPEVRMSKRGLWLTSTTWQESLMALLRNLMPQLV
jgi:transcription-repair coupling factor (superfamily II helicase)